VALLIDASTPAVATGDPTATTASFTPPAGSALLISFAGDSAGNTTPPIPTITDNLGTHLTYSLVAWQSRADTPTRDGQAAMWTAPIGTSAAMTVSVTNNSATVHDTAIKVWVLTGEHATPLGASGKSGSASAASIAQAYTAQATGGQGFIVVCDWDQKGAETAGTGCTVDGSANTTGITYGFGRRTTADDTNGAGNTLNVTLPLTSTNLAWVYAEIKPAATTASTLPQTSPRRRPAFPRLARTRATWPVGPQLNPPMPIQEIDQPRRIRGLLPRRGRTVSPVPPQVNPPFPIAETAQPRRLRGLLQRRARLAQLVPAQVVVTPPAYVPQPARARLKLLGARRRPRAALPPDQAPVLQAMKSRPRVLRLLRGHQALLVPPQVIVPAPPFVPTPARAPGRRALLQRRSRGATVVPPQQTVIPPAWLPPPTRTRIRSLGLRRVRSASVPAVSNPPPLVARPARRLWLPRPRRSTPRTPDTAAAPVTPKFVPPATRHRPFAWLRRRPTQSPPLAGPATVQVRDLVLTVGQPVPKWTAGPPTTRWRTDDPRTRWTTTTPATRWATKDPAVNTTAGPPRT
jgi:hypothetical protein